MKKKDYQKPTMNVVKLQHHGMLMTSRQGTLGSPVAPDDDEWEDE